jgi:pimeloyl-ACP methyl ester carboxylesterase
VLSAEKLPSYYKVAGRLKMHRLIPVSLLKSASLMKRLFTAETPEQKAYLKKTIREIDNSFIKWALNAVVTWNGKISDVPYVHIHGSKDFILPVRFCNPTHVIKGAGHLMILTKTNEINKILEEYIRSSYPHHT